MPTDSTAVPVCSHHDALVGEVRELRSEVRLLATRQEARMDQLVELLTPRDLEETFGGRCLALVGRLISLAKPMATPIVGILLAAAVLVATMAGTGLSLVSDILSISTAAEVDEGTESVPTPPPAPVEHASAPEPEPVNVPVGVEGP